MLAETSIVVQTELPLIERVSSCTKLRRQRSNKHIKGEVLLSKELLEAENFLYKQVQLPTYGEEIEALEKGRNLLQSNIALSFPSIPRW